MPTIREDIDFDKVRSAFAGMQLTDNVKRMMVQYGELELKWSHGKSVKCAQYLINEARAQVSGIKPNTYTEVMKTIENAPTQKRAR